jgi:N-acetylneuraminic acid mutarotase
MKNKYWALILIFIFMITSTGMTGRVSAFTPPEEGAKTDNYFMDTGSMHFPRSLFTLSLLPDGKVLAAGGFYNDGSDHYLNTSEIYNPIDGLWYLVPGSMTSNRRGHTATTLLDGRILVVGGENGTTTLNKAEIYDPATNTWSDTSDMLSARVGHTATRLADGRVLVAGGCSSAINCNNSTEIYNPTNNTWYTAAILKTGARKNHAAVLMNDGRVMVTGGFNFGTSPGVYYQTAEIYDPILDEWTQKSNMSTKRSEHFAVVRRDGKVLVIGGFYRSPGIGGTVLENYVQTSQLYDPGTDTWSTASTMWNTGRRGSAAILDPFGKYYLIAGYNSTHPSGLSLTEYRDIDTDSDWIYNGFPALNSERFHHAAIQLANGAFLVAGGMRSNSDVYYATTEIYQNLNGDAYIYANSLSSGSFMASGTLLENGDILISGGSSEYEAGINKSCSNSVYLWRTDLDDRDNMTPMQYARCGHSTTLLSDGRVVVIGGSSSIFDSVGISVIEILNGGQWQRVVTDYSIAGHTATLLPDGEILIVGLSNEPNGLLFNPNTLEARQTIGQYTGSYNGHTATLMPDGKVLLLGSSVNNISELYDPATETFSVIPSPFASNRALRNHTATLLPDGRVLIAGGMEKDLDTNLIFPVNETYIYKSSTNSWNTVGDMTSARGYHSATLMPDGKLVVFGGKTLEADAVNTVEIYDPATYSWYQSGTMTHARAFHKTLLTTQGNIFVFGGYNQYEDVVSHVERYYFWNSSPPIAGGSMWQPLITDIEGIQNTEGLQYTLSGSQLIGDVEASSGLTGQSATNHPLVRVMRLNNQQMMWLNVDGAATEDEFAAKLSDELPPGPALVFVFANGSRSNGVIALSTTPPPPITEEYEVYLPLLIR